MPAGLVPGASSAYDATLSRLRILSEAECYARCYHMGRDDTVKIVHIEPRRPRFKTRVSGEQLRKLFEERLAKREPVEK
jgi:hypothetical protein